MKNPVVDYYTNFNEKDRLTGEFSLERIRSREIISRFLPANPQRIVDIGGAAGEYSFWLSRLGHRVTLVDLTPRHIEQALARESEGGTRLEKAFVGDACALELDDGVFDIALLMGPLYHLSERTLRIKALMEAARVIKNDGILLVAAISRYASLFDGFKYDLVKDPLFRSILDQDLKTGSHINNTDNTVYFTTAHLHHLEELEGEIRGAGLRTQKVLAVEGFGSCLPMVEERMTDPDFRTYLLQKIRDTEEERTILGVSAHTIAVITKGNL